MAVIRNRLNQRVMVNLNEGKNIDLMAKGKADVSEDDLSSPHLQTLIARGDVFVLASTESSGIEVKTVKKKGNTGNKRK